MASKQDDSMGTGVYFAPVDHPGFSRRLLAILIDLAVVWALYAGLWRLVDYAWDWISVDPFLLFGVTWVILSWLYLTVLKSSKLRTLGFRVAELKIVTLRGERPSVFRMTFRLMLWCLGPFNLLLDLVWLGVDSEGQTLRDCFAGTCVVRNSATPQGTGAIHLAYYTTMGATLAYPRTTRSQQN